jgi:FlaA1/EpsC-like NDP-sugar epimerase/EAL domain-containing protein (putative c-di-GMP-specific phosphodiesterase class I)
MTHSIVLRNRHFFLLDIGVACLTPILALTLRLDGVFNLSTYAGGLITATLLFLIVKLAVFYQLGLYKHYWHYASIDELTKITALVLAATLLQTIAFDGLYGVTGFSVDALPRSLPIFDGILTLIFVGTSRFSIRFSSRMGQRMSKRVRRDRVLIVGAGNSGIDLVKKMQSDPQRNPQPVAFIDDNPAKINRRIQGLTVVENHYQIPKIVHSLNIDRVIIAMPSVSGKVIQEIFEICQSAKVKTSILPRLDEIINHQLKAKTVREIEIKDLLRREPIQTDMQRIAQFIKGKKVVITGAGGSIGSEICRQVLKCCPAEMILLGHGENSIFNIEQELRQTLKILQQDGNIQGQSPHLTTLIADIRFASRLDSAFAQFQPEIIFHAAAHKHVPLMEVNTAEAVTNNIKGTKNLVDLAVKYDVKHFVMISTDKAVNPTNIMGTTKRVAEMLVLQAAQRTGKAFGIVRFGNVLGSRGSVVPTFKKQIAAGGPITVTHPDICRYFITIPEAVQLTLQASVLGRSGEVIMLNMGDPVKIVDLATELIQLSGYEPGKEIDIKFTGLRPGEKLFEEMFMEGEDYQSIESDKMYICKNASRLVSSQLDSVIPVLCQAAANHETEKVVNLLQQLVPEYTCKQPDDVAFPIKMKSATPNLLPPSQALPSEYQEAYQSVQDWLNPEVLWQALTRNEFKIYYQPIVSLPHQQTVSFEALLRWQHPQQLLIPARELMSVLEQSGLIIPVGDWVLWEVCQHIQTLQQKSSATQPLAVSVNFSQKQLLQPDLIQKLKKIFAGTHLQDPSSLIFEIPYSFLQDHAQNAITLLPQLKRLGVQLQIDQIDQNLIALRQKCQPIRHCFTALKVNLSYLLSPENKLNIVRFSQENRCDIIATGVEFSHHLELLERIKCDYCQGYLFAQPEAAELYNAKAIKSLKP